MTKGLHVTSEIGQLKKVCLHRPGDELLNLPPSELDRLLFEDVPFLEDAQAEHDAFAQTLRDQGVEVVYLEDLVAEAFDAMPSAREEFLDQYLAEAGIKGKILPAAIREVGRGYTLQRYKGLGEMNPEQLWDTTLNPDGRRLVQVTIEDLAEAERRVTILMGDKVEPRKAYISAFANFNRVDDFKPVTAEA